MHVDTATFSRGPLPSPERCTMMMCTALLLALPLARAIPRMHAPTCHDHEEVRAGEVWIVDCRDNGVDTVAPMALGEFRYTAGDAEWSSRDPHMKTVAVDLPAAEHCDASSLERWARCLELPLQFAWCGTETVARFVSDSSFPRYVDTSADFQNAVNICAPTNSTVRALPPIRAYNERTVYKTREQIEYADRAVTIFLGLIVLCCLCGNDCQKKRYSRVRGA